MAFARRCVITLMIVVATAMTAAAQVPPLYNIARVTVKPEHVNEWLDVQKQLTDGYKKGGGTWRLVLRNTVGNPFEFLVVSPMNKYAERDDPSFIQKGIGEGDLARLQLRSSQATEAVHTTIERSYPDLAIVTPSATMPKMLRMSRVRIKPGTTDQFLDLVKELVAGYRKIGITTLRFRRVDYGGSRNDFTMSLGMEKWAELDEQMLAVKALGQDGYKKWTEKVSPIIEYSEYVIYTYVASASIPPQ